MKDTNYNSLKKVAITAMLASMTTVFTYCVKVPMPSGGYIHLGDSVIYLSACLLPTPYAVIGAGIGGALADLFGGYFNYIIPTFIIKMLIAVPFSSKKERVLNIYNVVMVLPAGLISIVGYYLSRVFFLAIDKATATVGFWNSLFNMSTWAAAISNIPENTIQAIGSTVAFVIFALSCDSANIKKLLVN